MSSSQMNSSCGSCALSWVMLTILCAARPRRGRAARRRYSRGMDRRDGYRVAIVGAGPRGTSVLERLLANQRLRADGTSLQIHLIDPYPPGSGHVWRRDQSRLFLMNTPSLFPTVVPAARNTSD